LSLPIAAPFQWIELVRILAGRFKNHTLKTPKSARPTTSKLRGSVFDILQHQIEGARFLDLFAGSGAMGIEAFSRGAKSATFVEKNRQAAACIRENLSTLHIEGTVLQLETKAALKHLTKKKYLFDIIYMDPPYSMDVQPLLEELSSLLAPEGILILEQPKNTEIETLYLKQVDHRTLGDTSLLFFKKENCHLS